MDKVTRKLSGPYVSPYLRRPLRTLSDALSERQAADRFQLHERPSPGQSDSGRGRNQPLERKTA